MASLINLPGYQVQNALLNFAPLSDAIDSNRKNALMQDQMGMQREQMAQKASQFDRSFGLQQQADARAAQMQPHQIQLLEAQRMKALREASESGSGFGKEIKPYQTKDGRIWGVQASGNGGRMMHDLSNPNSQPIYIPAGRPMPPGSPPSMGQQPPMPQGGASSGPQAMPQPQAGPSPTGPLTPFTPRKIVGKGVFNPGTGGFDEVDVSDMLRGGEFAKKEADAVVKDIKDREEATQASRSKMPRLELLATLIDNPSVYQGTGAGAVLEFKRAAQGLGFDVEGVPASEAVRMIGNQFILALRNPAGGEGMPGAMSDGDRTFLSQSSVRLENTRDGNKLAVRAMIDLERFKMKENAEAQRYIRQRNSSAGLTEHMDAWAQKNPAISKQTRDLISRATGVQYGVRSGPVEGPRVTDKMGGRVGEQGGRSFASPGLSRKLPTVASDDDYNALPSGSEFVAPDGSRRRKP